MVRITSRDTENCAHSVPHVFYTVLEALRAVNVTLTDLDPPPPPPFFFFFFSLLFFNLFLRWQFKPKGGITKFCLEVTAGRWLRIQFQSAAVPQVLSVTDTHSGHRFPAPSSKLCHWDLVTPLKWQCSLSPRSSVHRRGQRPPKSLGTNVTVEAASVSSAQSPT